MARTTMRMTTTTGGGGGGRGKGATSEVCNEQARSRLGHVHVRATMNRSRARCCSTDYSR
eukprot:1238380-Pyramimonas_sp.AAC.1